MAVVVAVGVTACFAVLRHAVRRAAVRSGRRRERADEKLLVSEMIALYCRKQHKTPKGQLCPACQELQDYALARIDKCPFMETKTFCSACKVHCYKPAMREQIRAVMRWAGPRMLPVHPVLSVKHVAVTLKAKREAQKTDA